MSKNEKEKREVFLKNSFMKQIRICFAVLLLVPLVSLHAGDKKKVPPARTYTNPILSGDYADPSIVKVGDDFYMTHSSFRYAPGLLIWKSRDLVHWTPVTRALQEFFGDVWAPEIVHHKGKFYIYSRSTHGNFVITAPAIEGPWSKPVLLKVGEIDPGHVVGPDGKRYLHFSGGNAVGLSDDGLSVMGELKKVYDGWANSGVVAHRVSLLRKSKTLFQGRLLSPYFRAGRHSWAIDQPHGCAGPVQHAAGAVGKLAIQSRHPHTEQAGEVVVSRAWDGLRSPGRQLVDCISCLRPRRQNIGPTHLDGASGMDRGRVVKIQGRSGSHPPDTGA
jgi:hypothetical protein